MVVVHWTERDEAKNCKVGNNSRTRSRCAGKHSIPNGDDFRSPIMTGKA